MIIQRQFMCWHKKADFGRKEWLAANWPPARGEIN